MPSHEIRKKRADRRTTRPHPFTGGGGIVLAAVLLILAVSVGFTGCTQSKPPVSYDIAILNGRVIDPETGLDSPGYNVGINGGTIAAVTRDRITAPRIIDAGGRVVAPGFIDILSYNPNSYGVWNKVSDGVTTNLSMHGGAVAPGSWLRQYEKAGVPVNFGAAFFYNAARLRLKIRPDMPATRSQILRLRAKAEKGIREGALGIGMSPEYSPGTSTEEIEEMMRVAARFNVPVFFHIRYSDMEPPGTNLEALAEVIDAAKKTGAAIHIDHINSTGGTFSMDASLEMLYDARRAGVDVTACTYPYPFWATYLNSARFSPGWQRRFRIDYSDLQLGGTTERLTQDTFKRYQLKGKLAVAYAIPEEDVVTALRSPIVMIGSDGILGRSHNHHPRASGAFARTLARYVREDGVLGLREAIAKMTIMPARRLEAAAPALRKKGRIQEGADADIVIFDPLLVTDRATVEHPELKSEGFDYVLVNGQILKDPDGLHKELSPGRPLRSEVEEPPSASPPVKETRKVEGTPNKGT